MAKFAVLVEPWATYVKDWDFFVSEGGLKEKWGKRWIEVEAESIEDARRKGKEMPQDNLLLMAGAIKSTPTE